eukprot:7387567-Pyramimonas_sp.AAC.1
MSQGWSQLRTMRARHQQTSPTSIAASPLSGTSSAACSPTCIRRSGRPRHHRDRGPPDHPAGRAGRLRRAEADLPA